LIHGLIEILSGAFGLIARAAGVWFVVWAIRNKGGFDYKLDGLSFITRWSTVLIAFSLVFVFSRLAMSAPRLVALCIGMAFLVWPNLAYYLSRQESRSQPEDAEEREAI
jgi:hypothetical protein